MTFDPFQTDGVVVHFDDQQFLVIRHPDGRGVRLSPEFIIWAARELQARPAPQVTEVDRGIEFLEPEVGSNREGRST